MLQPYKRIRFPHSAVNRMKIKNLICKCNIRKWFSFYDKRIFDFITMFCIIISFSILKFSILISFDLSRWKNLYFYDSVLLFLWKFIPPVIFWQNLKTRHRFFCKCSLWMFIITNFTLKVHQCRFEIYLICLHRKIHQTFYIITNFSSCFVKNLSENCKLQG